MSAAPPVFVITGQLAAGKSTVARFVLDRFPLGIHIDVDGIRELVTSGRASPLAWSDETERQFDLAIRGSAALARVYADADFAVAIEGTIDPARIESALESEGLGDRMVGVVLRPRLEVALERNRTRSTKSFDTSVVEGVMATIDADLARDGTRPRWHTVDNSDEPIETTAARILSIAQ